MKEVFLKILLYYILKLIPYILYFSMWFWIIGKIIEKILNT